MSFSTEKEHLITEQLRVREYLWAHWALLKDRSEGFPLLASFRYSRAKAIIKLANGISDQEFDLLIMASLKENYKEILPKMEELITTAEQKKEAEIERETKKLYGELYQESIKPKRMARQQKIKKADMIKLFKKSLLEECRAIFGEKGGRFDPGEFFFTKIIEDWTVRTDLNLNDYDLDFLSFNISYRNNPKINYIFRYEYALSVASEWPGSLFPEDVPGTIEKNLYLIKRFNEIDALKILNGLVSDLG